ncbi:MAG: AAA family ATPase, partial [Anaerolineaceae bacterium]|nr:AAA family ATPase [Anaerolineaceae bacterium]
MIAVAIVNQKGGVGKTTSAVTLAHGLALRNHKTLLLDLDAQGNVADCLGLPSGGDLYRLLFPGIQEPFSKVITPSGRKNLSVIRSDKTTTNLKIALGSVELREYVLDDLITGLDFDVIIMDCAP